jgi:hypothetical protein
MKQEEKYNQSIWRQYNKPDPQPTRDIQLHQPYILELHMNRFLTPEYWSTVIFKVDNGGYYNRHYRTYLWYTGLS